MVRVNDRTLWFGLSGRPSGVESAAPGGLRVCRLRLLSAPNAPGAPHAPRPDHYHGRGGSRPGHCGRCHDRIGTQLGSGSTIGRDAGGRGKNGTGAAFTDSLHGGCRIHYQYAVCLRRSACRDLPCAGAVVLVALSPILRTLTSRRRTLWQARRIGALMVPLLAAACSLSEPYRIVSGGDAQRGVKALEHYGIQVHVT